MAATRSAGVLVVLLTLTCALPRAGQPVPAPELIVAVVRDNVLQPVARVEGAAWSAPSASASASWPRSWLVWSSGVVASKRVSTTARAPAGACTASGTMTLASTSDSARGRLSVATSADAPVSPVHLVSRGSREWNAAVAALPPLFEKRANQSGISPLVLARVPATLDAMFVSDTVPAVYYLEASKRVTDAGSTPAEDPRGVVRLALTGWFRADGPRLVPAATKAELHWEAADDRSSPANVLEPIALVRQAGRDVWLMVATVGNRTSYAFYAVTASAVRVLVTVDESQC